MLLSARLLLVCLCASLTTTLPAQQPHNTTSRGYLVDLQTAPDSIYLWQPSTERVSSVPAAAFVQKRYMLLLAPPADTLLYRLHSRFAVPLKTERQLLRQEAGQLLLTESVQLAPCRSCSLTYRNKEVTAPETYTDTRTLSFVARDGQLTARYGGSGSLQHPEFGSFIFQLPMQEVQLPQSVAIKAPLQMHEGQSYVLQFDQAVSYAYYHAGDVTSQRPFIAGEKTIGPVPAVPGLELVLYKSHEDAQAQKPYQRIQPQLVAAPLPVFALLTAQGTHAQRLKPEQLRQLQFYDTASPEAESPYRVKEASIQVVRAGKIISEVVTHHWLTAALEPLIPGLQPGDELRIRINSSMKRNAATQAVDVLAVGKNSFTLTIE